MTAVKLVAVAVLLAYPLSTAARSPSSMSSGGPPSSSSSHRRPPTTEEGHALDEVIEEILTDIKSLQREALEHMDHESRPFVLASFAQSLDGQMAPWTNEETLDKEAKKTASNYPLSGPESLVLTHAIRSIHDGILIGGRTLAIDNSRLTNRLWKVDSETAAAADQRSQPIPIVVDTHLKNVNALHATGIIRAQNVVVCCDEDAPNRASIDHLGAVRLLPCSLAENHQLDMRDVLQRLRAELGIRTLMVEGGASILSTLFAQGLVDAVCITIAPKALCGGIAPVFGPRPVDLTPVDPTFRILGNDCVLISRWPATTSIYDGEHH